MVGSLPEKNIGYSVPYTGSGKTFAPFQQSLAKFYEHGLYSVILNAITFAVTVNIMSTLRLISHNVYRPSVALKTLLQLCLLSCVMLSVSDQ